MKRTRNIALALALSALSASVLGACPASPSAPCASDADCGGNAACVVVDGAGTCSIVAPPPGLDPAEGDDEPADGGGDAQPGEGEGEPDESEPGEGEGEPDGGEPGEGEPGEGGVVEPGPLNLGRMVDAPGASVLRSSSFTLRGALSTSTRASSSTFVASARSSR